MQIVIAAAVIYIVTLVIRAFCLKRETTLGSAHFWGPLVVCVIANIIAYWGFWTLASGPADESVNYGSILSVLSLLSAGVIAGNFAFTHQEAASDETVIVTIIASCLISLFYMLFASVCFYSGKSIDIQSAPGAAVLIPTIVFVILLVNTFYEFWDFREEP